MASSTATLARRTSPACRNSPTGDPPAQQVTRLLLAHLVVQAPSDVLQIAVCQEVSPVGSGQRSQNGHTHNPRLPPVLHHPDAQLSKAEGSDLGPHVTIAVHKHTRENPPHGVLQLCPTALQLQVTTHINTDPVTGRLCTSARLVRSFSSFPAAPFFACCLFFSASICR